MTSKTASKASPRTFCQIVNRAPQRLHRAYHRMRARGKPHNVNVVACGRELACFRPRQPTKRADSPTGLPTTTNAHQSGAIKPANLTTPRHIRRPWSDRVAADAEVPPRHPCVRGRGLRA